MPNNFDQSQYLTDPFVNLEGINTPDYKPLDVQKGSDIDFFGLNDKSMDLTGLLKPQYFDAAEANLSKYKNSDYFSTLGFDINRDNEELYGMRQTTGNSLANGFSQMKDLGWYQFKDQLKGWGRMVDALASWDSSKLWGDGAEANNAFMETMNNNGVFMTQKERDSIFNWKKVSNIVGQSGFTLGAISEIAFEELVTFGAASMFQGAKVGKLFKTLSMWGKDARQLEKAVAPASKLKAWFFKNAENFGKVPFVGETSQFGSELLGLGKRVSSIGETESTMAVLGRGFGAFYRDLREMNAAMTEARAEASGTYADLKLKLEKDLIDSGKEITSEELNKIDAYAKKAADSNFIINTAIIGLSNKLQFDGVFKGITGTKRMFEEGAIGTIAKDKTTEFFKRGLNLKTLKESITKQPLNYFKNNITEALQENMQDASNIAVQAYYEAKYKNPGKASISDAISKGLGEQFSKQGLETFLSGFATAAITTPMIKGVKSAYTLASTTKQERIDRENKIDEQISQLNSIFSTEKAPSTGEFLSLQQLMAEASTKGNKKDFQDAKDFQTRNTARLLIETGQKDAYFDMLNEFTENMSKQEFEEAFGVDFNADNKKNISEYIDSFKNKVESLEEANKRFEYKFGTNPFKPNDTVNFQAWKNAKWHVLYTQDAHMRAIQRSTELINTIPQQLKGLSSSQIIPLIDNSLLEDEIKLLQQEIKINPKLAKTKEERLNVLLAIKEQNKKAINPEEGYNRSLYEKYLISLAKENKLEFPKEILEEALTTLRDVKNLKFDERNLIRNINWLIDPKNVAKLQQLHLEEIEKIIEEAKNNNEVPPSEIQAETTPVKEEEKSATFQPTDKFNQPTGEKVTTSTESVSKETPSFDFSEVYKELFEEIFNSGVEFENNQINTEEDFVKLFEDYEGSLNAVLKKYNVKKEDFLQDLLSKLQEDGNYVSDFQDDVMKLVSVKTALEKILQDVEQGNQIKDNQKLYLSEQKSYIDTNKYLSAIYNSIQEIVKSETKPESTTEETNKDLEELQQLEPIQDLETDEVPTIEKRVGIKTSYREAVNNDKLDVPFTSVYDMTIGGLIRYINSPEGKQVLESLGYKLKIQKITSNFFNSHSPIEQFITSERDPYNFFKKKENKDVTNYAFVIKDEKDNDVYINPYYFSDNEQDLFTTEDKGIKIAINIPKGLTSEEVYIKWEMLEPIRGQVDKFNDGTLTYVSDYLNGAFATTEVASSPLSNIPFFIKNNTQRTNGGLYLEFPNGTSIKLLPSSTKEIVLTEGSKMSLRELVEKEYSPEQTTEMIGFLNRVLQIRSNTENPSCVAERESPTKIKIVEMRNTKVTDKGVWVEPQPTNKTTEQILREFENNNKRINILNVDFNKDDEKISVPLFKEGKLRFKQMKYSEFVYNNTLTNKKRYVDPLTGQIRIQTIHDGFSIPETIITATKTISEKQSFEELLKCLNS